MATTKNVEQKTQAAKKAMEFIKEGMDLGLGSGSTSEIAIGLLAERIRQGLKVRGIPSSDKVRQLSSNHNIPLAGYDEFDGLDLNFDGADEVDPNFQLIKGGGGAMLREKVNAFNARINIIMVDESKMVDQLGAFPLPLEINPFGHQQAKRVIEQQYQITTGFREAGEELFITDNGNLVLDCDFQSIPDPGKLDRELKSIPGVLETGLFIDLAHVVVVASSSGIEVMENPKLKPQNA